MEKRAKGAGVFNAKTGRRSGAAVPGSTGRTSATWGFLPTAVGNPANLGWRVEVGAPGGSRIDATPNSGFVKRRLR